VHRHFVITRLGLGVYNGRWYDYALKALEAITFPSVSRQTRQDFFWLLTVDSQMPPDARRRLENLLEKHPNYHIVPVDLMQVRGLRHGGTDWLFESCQDYILQSRLLTDPTDYVITSRIDADDAWSLEVIATVNDSVAEHLPLVRAQEANRPYNLRHTAGLAITFPLGWEWFIQLGAVRPLRLPFLSMAVFIAHRFSAGVSALSIRHLGWAAYADIIDFKRIELFSDRAMWVYARHQLNTTEWKADQALPLGMATAQTLNDRFGIDIKKTNALMAAPGGEEPAGAHIGQHSDFAEQHDRLYRIAALTRQINVLERDPLDSEPNASTVLIAQQKFHRAALIEEFRGVGRMNGSSLVAQLDNSTAVTSADKAPLQTDLMQPHPVINLLKHFLKRTKTRLRIPSISFPLRIRWLLYCLTLIQLGIRPQIRLQGRRRHVELIIGSAVFDLKWYLKEHDDVRRARVDPLLHYLAKGAAEGRDPNPLFDSDWYLQRNSDVRLSGINPLVHYLQYGAAEGRDPHPLFDTDWYLANNPDVSWARLNPLSHYLHYGTLEGRVPNSGMK
jgi:hypothetical protein